MSTENTLRRERIKTGQTQAQYWSRLGITQSGGSRYENGLCKMPASLQKLIAITYGPEAKAMSLVKKLRAR